jgi:hypothetical protein
MTMVGLGLGLTAENPARKLAVDIVAKRRKPDKLVKLACTHEGVS